MVKTLTFVIHLYVTMCDWAAGITDFHETMLDVAVGVTNIHGQCRIQLQVLQTSVPHKTLKPKIFSILGFPNYKYQHSNGVCSMHLPLSNFSKLWEKIYNHSSRKVVFLNRQMKSDFSSIIYIKWRKYYVISTASIKTATMCHRKLWKSISEEIQHIMHYDKANFHQITDPRWTRP
jgi:hypothetical protein